MRNGCLLSALLLFPLLGAQAQSVASEPKVVRSTRWPKTDMPTPAQYAQRRCSHTHRNH